VTTLGHNGNASREDDFNSASSQRPHEQELRHAPTEPATPSPPELSHQLLAMADSVLDLGTNVRVVTDTHHTPTHT